MLIVSGQFSQPPTDVRDMADLRDALQHSVLPNIYNLLAMNRQAPINATGASLPS